MSDLERVVEALVGDAPLTLAHAEATLMRGDLRHDRAGDDHYDVVSALIKSMRGSDPDAAIYWLARMLAAGEDPMFVARRLVIFAAEDVGNADPRGIAVASACMESVARIGMPEARILLAQAVTWLACCPKSNAAYKAIDAALDDVKRTGALPVPAHLKSRPPPGAPAYLYPHDHPDHVVAQVYRPPEVAEKRYYQPVEHGEEKTIAARLAWWRQRLGGRR